MPFWRVSKFVSCAKRDSPKWGVEEGDEYCPYCKKIWFPEMNPLIDGVFKGKITETGLTIDGWSFCKHWLEKSSFENLVILTNEEMSICNAEGLKRHLKGNRKNIPNNYGLPEDEDHELQIDIDGFSAEFAYCKFQNLDWSQLITNFAIGGVDINPDIQIRSTRWNNGHLYINDSEKDLNDHYYVLVITKPPKFRIIGWMHGAEGKQNIFLKERPRGGYGYAIPQSELHRHFPIKRRS